MSIDDFKGLMDEFDPLSLLPELDSVVGAVAGLARLIVLTGPVALLIMGLLFLFAAPKEANHYLGYRTYFGMGSVEAWRYSQHLAGIVFGALGLVLSIIMLLVCGGFGQMETMDLLWKAVSCVLWEAGLTVIAWLSVNTVLMFRYDSKGDLRKNKVKR